MDGMAYRDTARASSVANDRRRRCCTYCVEKRALLCNECCVAFELHTLCSVNAARYRLFGISTRRYRLARPMSRRCDNAQPLVRCLNTFQFWVAPTRV